jgi:hypothetical protein
VHLVDYHGAQPHGFTLDEIPDGWVLKESIPSDLVIAPASDTTSGADFRGKLVVMLQSVDVTGPPKGTPVTVNGHPGAIRDEGEATMLDYTDGTHRIYVQCWDNLGWSKDQLVEFAAGIGVTADVVPTHG